MDHRQGLYPTTRCLHLITAYLVSAFSRICQHCWASLLAGLTLQVQPFPAGSQPSAANTHCGKVATLNADLPDRQQPAGHRVPHAWPSCLSHSCDARPAHRQAWLPCTRQHRPGDSTYCWIELQYYWQYSYNIWSGKAVQPARELAH